MSTAHTSTDGPSVAVSNGTTTDPAARNQLFEAFFAQLYLDKDVYTFEDSIVLRWPRKYAAPANYAARLRHRDGRIYAEATGKEGDSGDRILTQALSIPDGVYDLILMPDATEFYNHGIRYQRTIPLTVVRTEYARLPYGTFSSRQIELLQHAEREESGLFSEIAKMALGHWQRMKQERITGCIDSFSNRQSDVPVLFLGLIGLVYRFGNEEAFPATLTDQIQNHLCAFDFQQQHNATSGGNRLLLSAAEYLAGQRYTETVFSASGQAGSWHRQHGAEAVLAWLQRAASHGFPDLSAGALTNVLLALIHLIDLAEDEPIWQLATILADKLLATVALNSFQGVYSPVGAMVDAARVDADRTLSPVKVQTANGAGNLPPSSLPATGPSGHSSPLAGVSRLLWGMGTWNSHLATPVSLACSETYEVPPVIKALAEDQPEAMAATERHSIADSVPGVEAAANDYLERRIFKTPDYLLSSWSSNRQEPVASETIGWQATLGPDAIISWHSVSASEREQAGSEHRIAHHDDFLILLARSTAGTDGLATNVYFPTFAFEKFVLRGNWAFAAAGSGYLALACSRPMEPATNELATHENHARRLLQATGQNVVWLCQMGSQNEYGSFANFRKRMLGSRFDVEGLAVHYRKLRGDKITFGWDEPLRINDERQLDGSAKHYDGPNCITDSWPASTLIVVHGEQAIQLQLDTGQS